MSELTVVVRGRWGDNKLVNTTIHSLFTSYAAGLACDTGALESTRVTADEALEYCARITEILYSKGLLTLDELNQVVPVVGGDIIKVFNPGEKHEVSTDSEGRG